MSRRSNNTNSRRPKNRPDEEWITSVKPQDVLFGRGSGPNDHQGNVYFRQLVAERKPDYLATTHRQTKAAIAREICNVVWSEGGRFLKRVDGGVDAWCVVDEDTTLEKAKQALRQNREKAPAAAAATKPAPPPPVQQVLPPKAPQELVKPPEILSSAANERMAAPPPRSPAVRKETTQQQQETTPASREVTNNEEITSSSLLSASGFSAIGDASMTDSLGMDPYEPIPVGVLSERQSMTSGLEVWADFESQQQQKANQGGGGVAPAAAHGGAALERCVLGNRRQSLQISDLESEGPLEREPESSTEMDDVTSGIMRLSTQTMDDEAIIGSSDTIETVDHPRPDMVSRGMSSGTNSTKASHASNVSNMSGVSVESDSLLAAAKLVTGPLHDASSSSSSAASPSFKQQFGASDASIQLEDVYKREPRLVRPIGGVIEEEDPDETGQLTTALPRRVSVMDKDPDNMSYLGSSSMSVLKSAMARSNDSTMTFSKGQLSEMLDDGGDVAG